MRVLIVMLIITCILAHVRGPFVSYDANGDGKITLTEFNAKLNGKQHDVENLIEIFDLDGDGMIDKYEFSEIAKMYED